MALEHQELIVREHERFACRLEAILRIESRGVTLSGAAADGPDTITVAVVDCSAGGAGLQTSVFLPRGCCGRLCVSFPASAASPPSAAGWMVEAPVRLQRVAMISRDPMYYLGAAFVDLDETQWSQVSRMLQLLRTAEATAASPGGGPGGSGGKSVVGPC